MSAERTALCDHGELTAAPHLVTRPRGGNPMEVAWLIERGQAEKQAPTVWWVGDPEATSRNSEDWTQDAYKATWFKTEAAAVAVIERLLTDPLGRASARATEHGFD